MRNERKPRTAWLAAVLLAVSLLGVGALGNDAAAIVGGSNSSITEWP